MIVHDLRACADPNAKPPKTELVRLELGKLNDKIRANGKDGSPPSPIRFSELARAIYHLALNAGEIARDEARAKSRAEPGQKPEQGDNKLTPRWSMILSAYEELQDELGLGLLEDIPSHHMIGAFCRYETRRSGSHSVKTFYVGLAILVVRLAERGLFDTPFMKVVCAQGEADFPDRVRLALKPILDLGRVNPAAASVAQPAAQTTEPAPPEPAFPEVSISFAYRPERLASFLEYRNHFATSHRNQAHFIMYRPSRSDPMRLIKSYLTIRPPEPDDPGVVKFIHVYKAPDGGAERFTFGRVIALDEGVYLIGGQRDADRGRWPYKTVKVMAFPWFALTARHTELRCLTMSSNQKGLHIISRGVVRTTPIGHSSLLTTLGGVEVGQLGADLRADAQIEIEVIKALADAPTNEVEAGAWRRKFPLSAETPDVVGLRRNLLKLCNNAPNQDNGWDAGPAFSRRPPAKSRDTLTTTTIRNQLEQQFGSKAQPVFQRPSPDHGEPEIFDFWTSLRFGPLAND